MTISYTRGNILDATTEALVNTVNTVGIMGKGLAALVKKQFPDTFTQYAVACKAGIVQTGRMFVTGNGLSECPRWIINFPTKQHWRDPSRMEWVISGLQDLRRVITERGIHSIAIPALGCGNGGLLWPEVKKAIEATLADIPDVNVIIFEPDQTDTSERRQCPKCGKPMVVRTAKKGPNTGSQFWGCSGFPVCKATLPISAIPVHTGGLANNLNQQDNKNT